MAEEMKYFIQPNLLEDGLKFDFEFRANKSHVEIVIDTNVASLLDISQNNPEKNATLLLPFAKLKMDQIVASGILPKEVYITVGDIKTFQMDPGIQVGEDIKIRNYVATSGMNVFSDPNVPLSARVISEGTGVPEEDILGLVGNGKIEGLDLVKDRFVIANKPLDII